MDIVGAPLKRPRTQEVVVETPGSQSSLHRANLERVVRAVRLAGSLTQAEIARTTGLSLMPVGLEEQITPGQMAQLIGSLKRAGAK